MLSWTEACGDAHNVWRLFDLRNAVAQGTGFGGHPVAAQRFATELPRAVMFGRDRAARVEIWKKHLRRRMSNLPDGWAPEGLRVVGKRRRIGDRHFVFGGDPPPGLAAGRLPDTREPFIVVGTGGGYLLFYTDFLTSNPKEFVPMRVGNLNEREPIGNWERAHNQFYPTIYPIEGGNLFHLVAGRSSGRSTQIEWCRKLDKTSRLEFWFSVPFLQADGKPAAIDWRRNGRYDLLVAGEDGFLRLHRRKLRAKRFAFEDKGEPVRALDHPIRFHGWAYPAVVDWEGAGRSDLLVGTESGDVWLFRDIGGSKEVRYDRGRALRTLEGPLNVSTRAVPAPVVDANGRFTHLLVMSGRGELFAYEMQRVDSYVTADIAKAFGKQDGRISTSYRKGAWWLRRRFAGTRSGQLLTTCRHCLPRDFGSGPSFDELVENVASEIELAPPFRGHFEVHVGLYKPSCLPFPADPRGIPSNVPSGRLLVRAEGEPSGQFACPDEMSDLPTQEVYVGVKDLTAWNLVFSQGRGDYKRHGGYPCYLDYVRLVPTRPAKSERSRRGRVVAAIFDTFDWTIFHSTKSRAQVEDVVAKHAACGFDRIYYKAGGGGWEYPSEVPGAEPVVHYPGSVTPIRWPKEDFVSHITEINRFRIAAEACRKRGLECYAWIRITNQGEHVGSGWYIDRFFVERPQFRDRFRHGGRKMAISLAYPEVRRHLFGIFDELISYGIDGILIDFLRTPPTIVFPDPLIERFKKRHGVDPRSRPPEDPRILRLQADFVTDFLRRLRGLLKRRSPAHQLHVRIDSPALRKGWDVDAWIGKALVDAILLEHTDSLDPDEPPDLRELIARARGTECRVLAGFYRPYWGRDRKRPIHEAVVEEQTEKYFALGVDGVSFYESAEVLLAPRLRQAIRRIAVPETPQSIGNR